MTENSTDPQKDKAQTAQSTQQHSRPPKPNNNNPPIPNKQKSLNYSKDSYRPFPTNNPTK